jgi:hypothetical protein
LFEEIPRQRRGLAWLPARRVVLGPFVLGGGVALAALGGSVAVAATVITASTIGLSDLGHSHPRKVVAAASSSQQQPRSQPPVHATNEASAAGKPGSGSTTGTPSVRPPGPPATVPPAQSTASPTPRSPSAPAVAGPTGGTSAPGSSSATPSPSQPAGNATIWVSGYDSPSLSVLFQYARVQHGAGSDGGDLYSIDSPATYRAGLARAVTIVSGRTLCPPAGNRCTSSQLIAAAPNGFYAEVGIDADGSLQSVIERDNPGAADSSPSRFATQSSSNSPTPSASASG